MSIDHNGPEPVSAPAPTPAQTTPAPDTPVPSSSSSSQPKLSPPPIKENSALGLTVDVDIPSPTLNFNLTSSFSALHINGDAPTPPNTTENPHLNGNTDDEAPHTALSVNGADPISPSELKVPLSGGLTPVPDVNGTAAWSSGYLTPKAPARLWDDRPIFIIVMGVAGTGKTTLARALNEKLGMPYVEGDDLHPKSNIEKMSQGIPLTDEDREPWLHVVRKEAEKVCKEQVLFIGKDKDAEQEKEEKEAEEKDGGPKPRRRGVMVTCSSLKRYYRAILRGSSPTNPSTPTTLLPTYFVYIKEDVPLLRERIGNRKGHFMKSTMLDSQLATLESPEGEENVVVVPLNASTEEQVNVALEGLEKLVGPLTWDH